MTTRHLKYDGFQFSLVPGKWINDDVIYIYVDGQLIGYHWNVRPVIERIREYKKEAAGNKWMESMIMDAINNGEKIGD